MRVHVILDHVVALVVRTERPATLLVDERVRDHVGPDVAHPTERVGQELVVLLLAATGLPLALGLGEQVRGHLAGVPVVEHVAPDERLLVPALTHLQAEPREQVRVGQHLHLDHLQDRVGEVLHRRGELLDQASGQVVEDGHDLVHELLDGLVVDLDERLPGLLQTDQDAGDLGEGPVDLGEQQEQRLVVVLLGRVRPVVRRHRQHQDVVLERRRRQRSARVVLAEEEQVGADGAQRREPLPVLHDLPTLLRGQAVSDGLEQAARHVEGAGRRVAQQVRDATSRVDVGEVPWHEIPCTAGLHGRLRLARRPRGPAEVAMSTSARRHRPVNQNVRFRTLGQWAGPRAGRRTCPDLPERGQLTRRSRVTLAPALCRREA